MSAVGLFWGCVGDYRGWGVAEVAGDVGTRRRTNLLWNVRGAHSYTVASSITMTSCRHVAGGEVDPEST